VTAEEEIHPLHIPVTDFLHSYDVGLAVEEFAKNLQAREVYNIGRACENNITMVEGVAQVEQTTSKKLYRKYVDENRKGDYICYISNLAKFRSHCPNWSITIGLEEILRQIILDQTHRLTRVEGT
jgi:CDP-paratose 2-epimerase